MVTIIISELETSSVTEINTEEMSSIKGGMTSLAVSRELLEAVPDLQAVRGIVLTPEVFNQIDSLSFGEIRGLFDFIPVIAAEEVPIPGPQIPRRGIIF